MPTFSPYAIPSAAAINPFVDPRFNPLVDKGIVKQPPQGQIASDYSPGSDDTHSPPATPQQQSDANSTLAGALATQATTPASYSSGNGIGPPPSDAMAKALLQNEEDIPLNRPFEAIGKLGALWGAQNAGQNYNKAMYDRQVAPYRELASALSGLPTDNPATYRRAAGQRMLDIGARYGNADMMTQGLQYVTAPQTEWDWKQDAAGNPIGIDKYNPQHMMRMDDNGNYVESLGGQPIHSSAGAPGGSSSGAAAPPGATAPTAGAPAGGDPYSRFRRPLNHKVPPEDEAYYDDMKQKMQEGVPASQLPDIGAWRKDQRQPVVAITGENEAQKALIDKIIVPAAENGPSALRRLEYIQTMRDAFKSGGDSVWTGPGAETVKEVKRALANAGVDVSGLKESEVIDKGGILLATEATKALSARPSQFEFAKNIEANPGLANSKEGSELLMSIIEQQAKRDQYMALQAKKALASGNFKDWADIETRYDDEHPFVSPFFKDKQGNSLPLGQADFDAASRGKPGAGGAAPPPPPGTPAAPAAPAVRVPSQQAIDALKQHPEKAGEFNDHFGAGSAAKVLGQ